MKITKYPQSCLLIESDTARVLIDPGSFVAAKYQAEQFGKVNAILITHEHSDHMHAQLIAALKVDAVKVYANASTAKLLGEVVTDVVHDNDTFTIGSLSVQARELPHVDLPDGNPGPQNTGYVINGVFFHPGDGVKIEGLTVQTGAIPIAGPDISPRDAFDLAKSLNCEVMIPIHFDAYPSDPDFFVGLAQKVNMPFKVVPLRDGESYDAEEAAGLTAS